MRIAAVMCWVVLILLAFFGLMWLDATQPRPLSSGHAPMEVPVPE